jgi:hypothetical protein
VNENRTIHFGVASNIFPPYLLLDRLAVRSEHLEFILTVSMEVIVQGFPARVRPTHISPHSFDVILFVKRTTAAHENPKHSEIEFRGGP